MTAVECIFCRIIQGTLPAEIVAENDHALAFADLVPQAPVHLLVVPKRHARDVAELIGQDPAAVLAVTQLATELARDRAEGIFRLVINSGAAAGQSVFHMHAHVLGGRSLSWPPG